MRDDRFSAGAKPTTNPKGMNDATQPKAGLTASGPKETNDGVSLTEGFKVLGHPGSSPQARALNTHGKTPGAKGSY